MPRKFVAPAGRSTWIVRSLLGFILCFLTQVRYIESFNPWDYYPKLSTNTDDILDISYSPAIWNGKVNGSKDFYANKAVLESNLFHDAMESLVTCPSGNNSGPEKLSDIEKIDGQGRSKYLLVIPRSYNPVAKAELFEKLGTLSVSMNNVLKANFIDDLNEPSPSYFDLYLVFDDFGEYEMHCLDWFSARGREGDEFLFKYVREVHPDIMMFLDEPLRIYPSTDMKPEEIKILDKLPKSEPSTLRSPSIMMGVSALGGNSGSSHVEPKDMDACEPYAGSYIRKRVVSMKPGLMWTKMDKFAEQTVRANNSIRDMYRCRQTAHSVITCGFNDSGYAPYSDGLVYMFDSGMANLDKSICNIGGSTDARLFKYGAEESVGDPDDRFSTVGHGTLMAGRISCSDVAIFASKVYSIKVYSGNVTKEKDVTYMYVSSYANAMYKVYKLCKTKAVPGAYHNSSIFLFGFTWLDTSSKYAKDHDPVLKKFTETAADMCQAILIAPAQNPENAAQPKVITSTSTFIYPKKSTKGTFKFNACTAYPRVYSDTRYFHTVGALPEKGMTVESSNSFEAYSSSPWPGNKYMSECIKFYGRGEASTTHVGGAYIGSYTKARGASMAAADIATFFARRIVSYDQLEYDKADPYAARNRALRRMEQESILALKGTLASYFNYPGIQLPPAIPGWKKDCMRAADNIYHQVTKLYPAHTYRYPFLSFE